MRRTRRKNIIHSVDLIIIPESHNELLLAHTNYSRMEIILKNTKYPSIQLIRAFHQALVTLEILKIKEEIHNG